MVVTHIQGQGVAVRSLDIINMTPEELEKGTSLAAQFVSNGNVVYEYNGQ